jgi:hypothetical protein
MRDKKRRGILPSFKDKWCGSPSVKAKSPGATKSFRTDDGLIFISCVQDHNTLVSFHGELLFFGYLVAQENAGYIYLYHR